MGWKEKAGPYGERKPESESLREHGLLSRRDFLRRIFYSFVSLPCALSMNFFSFTRKRT